MIIAGMAMPAMSAMPTGAPTSVPSCHRIFFLRLHGFFPQKVQPEGLAGSNKDTQLVSVKMKDLTLYYNTAN